MNLKSYVEWTSFMTDINEMIQEKARRATSKNFPTKITSD